MEYISAKEAAEKWGITMRQTLNILKIESINNETEIALEKAVKLSGDKTISVHEAVGNLEEG